MGVCYYELEDNAGPRKVVCDSLCLNGMTQAIECPMWQAVRTRESVKREFQKLIHGDKGQIAVSFPDIAALLWVLDTDEDSSSLDTIIREAPEEECSEQSVDSHQPSVPVDVKDGGSPTGTPRASAPRDLPVSGDKI
ncbi:MAG: hypothetical protein WCO84_09570 [bacterium]